MKIYDLRKKDGTPIQLDINEWNIYHNNIPLMDELVKLTRMYNILAHDGNQKFNTYGSSIVSEDVFDKYKYKPISGTNKIFNRNTVVNHKGLWFLTTDKCKISLPPTRTSNHFFQIDRTFNPICLFRDDGRSINSPFGFTYNDLAQMLRNDDYSKYIKDNDYIEIVIDGFLYTMRFNIDMYHDYSFTAPYTYNRNQLMNNIPHHIDMISDEIIPEILNQQLNVFNKSVGNLTSIAGDKKSRDAGIPNLYQSISNTFWNKYSVKLNPMLKDNIIEKYCRIGDRKVSDLTKSANNMSNVPIGRFWQPREPEIYGQAIISQKIYEGGICMQYPSFKYTGTSRREATSINNSSPGKNKPYITWSLMNSSTDSIIVHESGRPTVINKSYENIQNLLCFRFA